MSTPSPRTTGKTRPRFFSRFWFLLYPTMCGAALLFGGCTSLKDYVHNGFKVGPNYQRPEAHVAPEWIDTADARIRKESDDQSRWWAVFNDPVLNALICDAYRQNLTLREAGFRVLQARAQLSITRGELFPQYQALSGGFIQKAVSIEVANRSATPERFFGTWGYDFAVNWELDFWGRFRRAVEASDARLDASVADYDDVLVTLLGDIATNYVQLRTQEQQLQYLLANVKLQRSTLAIAQAQFKGGQVSELDPDQAQSNLSQTEADVPQLEIAIRQTTNRLCVLLGIPPEKLQERLGPGEIPTAPPDVALGTPADLLRRRPDVRRAERAAAAQAAEIGVAESDFYPAVSIAGTIGAGAQDFSHLFVSKAMSGSIGPSVQWNVLNYGRILNNVRLQEARFQESIARYQQTVLNANAEVENGLVMFIKSHQRVKALGESVRAAEKAVKAAVVQYTNGLIDFNRVALLQENLVTQQSLLAAARGDIALGLILTYKAMGGGWEIRNIGCEVPTVSQPLPPPRPALQAVDALRQDHAPMNLAGGLMQALQHPQLASPQPPSGGGTVSAARGVLTNPFVTAPALLFRSATTKDSRKETTFRFEDVIWKKAGPDR